MCASDSRRLTIVYQVRVLGLSFKKSSLAGLKNMVSVAVTKIITSIFGGDVGGCQCPGSFAREKSFLFRRGLQLKLRNSTLQLKLFLYF